MFLGRRLSQFRIVQYEWYSIIHNGTMFSEFNFDLEYLGTHCCSLAQIAPHWSSPPLLTVNQHLTTLDHSYSAN